MVNSFQGCLAELLAAAPCVRLLKELQRKGQRSSDFRLYAGNTVRSWGQTEIDTRWRAVNNRRGHTIGLRGGQP